jgi:tetratricopeptide (TPR) repeat protein
MLTLRPTAALLLALCAGPALAKPFCGDLANAFGPFDYRTPDPDQLYLVEMAHFTEDVQQGIKGNTGTLGADLDYTLRAFPNHTKALATMARVALRQKTPQLPGARYAVECYFERAVRFKADDGTAWAAYGQYLYQLGQTERALPLLKKAAELAPENASVNYNAGIAYAHMKNYPLAVQHAKKAYQLGFPLNGLRKMLVDAGKWDGKVEPVAQEGAGSDPASPSPAPR